MPRLPRPEREWNSLGVSFKELNEAFNKLNPSDTNRDYFEKRKLYLKQQSQLRDIKRRKMWENVGMILVGVLIIILIYLFFWR